MEHSRRIPARSQKTPRAAPTSPNPHLPSSLCSPSVPVMLLSQGLAAQSPSRVPVHQRDFGRHILLVVLWRMQGLAVMKTCEVQSSPDTAVWVDHVCSTSSPAPGALPAWQIPIWGGERRWEPRAGQGELGLKPRPRSGVNGSL